MHELKDLTLSKIISYLALIEQHINRKNVFENYFPSDSFVPEDIISIQKEASSMMKFVGLSDYTAVITYTKTKEGTAGSINLNNDKEIFIEVDRDLLFRRKSKETILGVLAHEICHKLLYTHGLYLSDTTSNEICTDLATIYVGFGMLTIQGCSEVNSWKEDKPSIDGSRTITTHTTSFCTGYLTPKSYILAYRIITLSYGLSIKELESALDNDVLKNAYRLVNQESVTFPQYTKDEIKEQFRFKSRDVACVKKDIILIRSILDDLEKELVDDYNHLDSIHNRIILGEVAQYPIAALLAMQYDTHDASKNKILKALEQFIEKISHNVKTSPAILNEHLRYVTCPICGLKSKTQIEYNSVSIRKCKCGCVFMWDAESIFKEEAETNIKNNEEIQNKTFVEKIKNIFKKK